MLQLRERVRWPGVKESSWAWPGTGEIVDFEAKRVGFSGAGKRPDGAPIGPAFAVRLDGPRQFIVWLAPDEIMAELPA